MDTIYGSFDMKQLDKYKVKLHKKLFWLILYKDPDLKGKYGYINFQKYFKRLMGEIDGLNQLLSYPPQIVEMMSLLQAAYTLTEKEKFDYKTYRKYVLDAHSLIDELKEVS